MGFEQCKAKSGKLKETITAMTSPPSLKL